MDPPRDLYKEGDHVTVEGRAPEETAGISERPIRVVLGGLMIAMLLAMLDNMIVGTAMPRIVGELGGLNHLSWVVTAYTLTTAASTPIWGKLGDLYGRKGMFMISIVIFMVGSALAGLSATMTQLIAFRGVQGLGAGGLIVGVLAIIGDLVPPRERGRYQGMMAGIMALALIGGPLIGGTITDHLGWRWSFYINLPLGVVALFVVSVTLRLPKKRIRAQIDYLGAILLTSGITALVLITTWGGVDHDWDSPLIIGLVALGVLSLAGFLQVERVAAEPILPLRVFRSRNFSLITIIGFLVGFVMFGAVTFLPLYQQTVQGASATSSGLLLLPMLFAMLLMSLIAGRMTTKTGRYKVFPIVGGALMTVGSLLLSYLDTQTGRLTSGLMMVVFGAGLGFLTQITMLIAQNSVDTRDLGVASSTSTLFRMIGGSFGVSLFGAFFAHRVNDTMVERLGPNARGLPAGNGQIDPTHLGELSRQVRDAYLQGVAGGTQTVFLWTALCAAVGFVAAWFIKEVPLRGGAQQGEPEKVLGETMAKNHPPGDRAAEDGTPPSGLPTLAGDR